MATAAFFTVVLCTLAGLLAPSYAKAVTVLVLGFGAACVIGPAFLVGFRAFRSRQMRRDVREVLRGRNCGPGTVRRASDGSAFWGLRNDELGQGKVVEKVTGGGASRPEPAPQPDAESVSVREEAMAAARETPRPWREGFHPDGWTLVAVTKAPDAVECAVSPVSGFVDYKAWDAGVKQWVWCRATYHGSLAQLARDAVGFSGRAALPPVHGPYCATRLGRRCDCGRAA